MMPYTIPIKTSEQQLMDLAQRIQQTPRPLLLAMEGVADPFAVVLQIDAYEKAQRQQYRFYHIELTHLQKWLNRVEQHWRDPALRQECVEAWQTGVAFLWEITPEPVQELCAALVIAVKQLNAETLSLAQIAALRYALALLRDSDPSETEEAQAHQKLMESGLSLLLSYEDDSLSKLYLDEL